MVHFFIKRLYSEAYRLFEIDEVQSVIMIFAISILIMLISYCFVRAIEKKKIGSLLILGK